ncbi:MAG: hypothetical protein U0R23_12420 [Candidatus Nanopelagicales bacterium]
MEGYFTAMVDESPAQMLKQSEPGSSAAAFAGYWRNGLDADGLAERSLVSTSDTDAVVKRTDDNTTTVYTDFVFNSATGLLESWSEQPGGPLRIVDTKKSGRVTPLKFSVRQQYVQNKDVVITILARNDNRQTITLTGESYVAPNGRSASINGYGKVPPRSQASIMLVAERARQVGGRLTLYTYPEDGGVTIAKVTVKLPAE